jgi:transcription elongation factor Elf1
MARHKQMPGRTYRVIRHRDGSCTVECTYLCPYCEQETTASFEAGADAADQLERGGFFEPLSCGLCGKVTDVRFWQGNKV